MVDEGMRDAVRAAIDAGECEVCAHPRRVAIEIAMCSPNHTNLANDDVAERFGLAGGREWGSEVVRQHAGSCMTAVEIACLGHRAPEAFADLERRAELERLLAECWEGDHMRRWRGQEIV